MLEVQIKITNWEIADKHLLYKMTLIKKGVSLLEDILMLPPDSCAITSHDDPTDRKGPLLTLVDKYFLQGPVFILDCLRLSQCVHWSKRVPVFPNIFWHFFLRYFPSYTILYWCYICWNDYIYCLASKKLINRNYWLLHNSCCTMLTILEPCREDESIWCQGSSQTCNCGTGS